MSAALALIIASIADLPSIVSIVGGLKVTRWWKLPFVIFLAVIFREILGAFSNPLYEPWEYFPFTLIAQTIVVVLVFRSAQAIRKRHADDPKRQKRQLLRLTLTLFLVCGLIFSALVFRGVQQGVTSIKEAKEQKAAMSASPGMSKPKTQHQGQVLLYREPVEIYWNDWFGRDLSNGKAYISGTGKTAMFEGILQLNCKGISDYAWLTASNGYNSRSLTEADLKRVVPIQVIAAASEAFCVYESHL